MVGVTAVNMAVMAVGKEEDIAAVVVLADTVVMGEAMKGAAMVGETKAVMEGVISNHHHHEVTTTDMHPRKVLRLLSNRGLTAIRRRPSHHLRDWIPTVT